MRERETYGPGRILSIQVALTGLAALLAVFVGGGAAASALIGASIATVANAVFALVVFRPYEGEGHGGLAASFLGGEVAKLVAASTLFVAAFVWIKPLDPLILVVAYLVVQVIPPLLAARPPAKG